MTSQPVTPRPGDNGFYVVTNADIYKKVTELEAFVGRMKTTLYILGFVVTPLVSTLVATIVTNTLKG